MEDSAIGSFEEKTGGQEDIQIRSYSYRLSND